MVLTRILEELNMWEVVDELGMDVIYPIAR